MAGLTHLCRPATSIASVGSVWHITVLGKLQEGAVYSAAGVSGWAFGSSPYSLGPCVPSLHSQINSRIAPAIGIKTMK